MISYTNENMSPYDMANVSLEEAYAYFSAGIQNALYEFDMGLLLSEYNYLHEHGYEMPLNEGWDEFKAWGAKLWEKIKIWFRGISRKVSDWFKDKYAEFQRWMASSGITKAKIEKAINAATKDDKFISDYENMKVYGPKKWDALIKIQELIGTSKVALDKAQEAFENVADFDKDANKYKAKSGKDDDFNKAETKLKEEQKKMDEANANLAKEFMSERDYAKGGDYSGTFNKSEMEIKIDREVAVRAQRIFTEGPKSISKILTDRQKDIEKVEKAYDKAVKDVTDPELVSIMRKTLKISTDTIVTNSNMLFKISQNSFLIATKILRKLIKTVDTKATT